MGDVVAKATEPALAAIKLAWWRERLEELDDGEAPAEPRLQSAKDELLGRGITGAELASLEDGWAALLETEPDRDRASNRGAALFAMASGLLGSGDSRLDAAGRLYALENGRRRGLVAGHSPLDELNLLTGYSFAKPLRPLTALAALSARDARQPTPIEQEATPGRAFALMRHWMTGRIA